MHTSTIEIRTETRHGCSVSLGAMIGGGFAYYLYRNNPGRPWQSYVFPALIAGIFLLDELLCMMDRSVKLCITAGSFVDNRKSLSIPWSDFRGIKASIRENNGQITSAIMTVIYVNGSTHVEESIDVSGLDINAVVIINTVRGRAYDATGIPQ